MDHYYDEVDPVEAYYNSFVEEAYPMVVHYLMAHHYDALEVHFHHHHWIVLELDASTLNPSMPPHPKLRQQFFLASLPQLQLFLRPFDSLSGFLYLSHDLLTRPLLGS